MSRLRRYIVAAVALVAGVTAITVSKAQSRSDQWWPGYGNGPDNSRYFASRQINKSNVTQLQVAWTYPHGETGSAPIVVRGVVYGRGRNGSLVAVDAKTGKELWIRENMTGMTSRGFNYWESRDGRDQRLIFAMNSLLQEVDAKTGKSIMTFGTNGVVDLREGIDGRDPATLGNVQSNTPGEIFENILILGSNTGEGYMSPPGDIRAYDVLTGKLVWTFHTVPRPGEFGYDTWPKDAYKYIGGMNAWGEMTLDTRRGIAYIPLGSPTYDFYGADRIGSNLFGTSVVALDARTGKRLWHFQIVHHDLWDLDPSAAPQLTTIRHNGRNRDVVVVTAKTGWLYVFDRVTGEPIWPIEERAVPKSEMEHEQSWPTQPFPTNPPPYIKHTFGVEDISPYLSPEEAETFKARLLAADNKGIFTPISLKDTVHVPDEQRRHALRRYRGGTRHRRGVRDCARQPRHPPAPSPGRRARRRCAAGIARASSCISSIASSATAPIVSAWATLRHSCTRRPIRCGTSRRARRAWTRRVFAPILATGKGRMSAFPHLTAAEVDSLVTFLATPRRARPRCGCRRFRRTRRRAAGGIGRTTRVDRGIRIGMDAAGCGRRARTRSRAAVS